MTKYQLRIFGLKFARHVRDDGLVEQFHHYVMTRTLVIMAILFSLKKYVAMDVWLPPVRCWVPAQFDRKYQRLYIYHLCWISGMYKIHFDEEIPTNPEDRFTKDRSIIYYQWICVIFAIQAVMFKFPNVVWNCLKSRAGINMKRLQKMTNDIQLVSEDNRRKEILNLTDYLTRWISFRRPQRESFCTSWTFFPGKGSESKLAVVAILVKVLNLLNVIGQFQFLSVLLGFDFWAYGLKVVNQLWEGEMFEDLNHFPKTALCDFQIRQLQNVHTYTVQCSLEFNMYMEKVFVSQWFIFLVLAVCTFLDLAGNVKRFLLDRNGGFINKYAGLLEIENKSNEKQLFKRFVRHYLMGDGVFIFKIVSSCSDVIATDLMKIMWSQYCKDFKACAKHVHFE